MRWTKEAVKFWLEHYFDLKEYRINPWKELYYWKGEPVIRGTHSFKSPFENLAILNAEFSLAIKKLTSQERHIVSRYIQGNGVYIGRIINKLFGTLSGADNGKVYLA